MVLWPQRPGLTETAKALADNRHTSQALSGDVNGGGATVGTMSLPLTPLVTDIQWPRWLKMGPAGPGPQKT